MARRSILREDEPLEIDLSPMIDCIFILLIFFIVATVFVEEQGLQVAKPDAAATPSTEETENVVLQITADNEIQYGGKPISLADVANRVRANLESSDTPVVVRAHEKSDHGVFVAVWDAARRGGAEKLSFTTTN
jgi:biopolymer transport protein ExbD